MMKFISPSSWFSIELPTGWHEFEDTEESFLFYHPDKWAGNFRISALRGAETNYAEVCMNQELKHNRHAKPCRVGHWNCIYFFENFQEGNTSYTTHFWLTGKGSISVECSMTVRRGESTSLAEKVVESLRIRGNEQWKEVIPVRVLEINRINEGYDWASSTIKKQLTKDFTASYQDILNLQKMIESNRFDKTQRTVWENFGIAFGVILINEMDGMDWVTVIDGQHEYPALRFAETSVMVYPLDIIYRKIHVNEVCDLRAEFERIKAEVESVL